VLARLRRKRWFNHLVRAGDAYTQRYGNHYAAAITYFSVLSLFPLIMIAFSVVGFILADKPALFAELKAAVVEAVPGSLGGTINELIDAAIEYRGSIGIFGLVIALYSGISWMSNLRDALTAQWGQERKNLPLISTALRDFAALVGLGFAILVSFGLTSMGSWLGDVVLGWLGIEGGGFAHRLLFPLTVILSLVANWLVFLWVLARLPRERTSARSAVRGAFTCAVGFEILKLGWVIFLRFVTASPAFAVFGPVIGLLLFANLVARFLLFVTAWTATAVENVLPARIPPPPPAQIRPVVRVARLPSARMAAGLIGLGALLGFVLRLMPSRRRR
jgi:membrane protein